MPPAQRVRFNAKARSSTAGSFHKKKGKRKETSGVSGQTDPNAEIVVPKSEDQKNEERKERLRQEVCFVEVFNIVWLTERASSQLLAQANSKFNSKKKKRLEKYIVR